MSGFMTTCISTLSTWTRRAKKLDEVQFSIPQGWNQRMIRNTQPWAMTRQAKHAKGGHRHKLRETWKNVPESTMKEVSKAAGLYQSLLQGDSYNTVVGCWFVNDAVRPQEWISLRSSSRCAATFSHLPWIHKPDKPIRKCKSSVGTSSNLNNLDPLLQTSKTSQSKVSDSNSQPSSRAAKSGKFTLFSRAIKHSGIHLEVLSLENRNSLNISSVFTEL